MFRYLLISLKRKLPLFIITFIIFAHMAFVLLINVDFFETYFQDYYGDYHFQSGPSTNLIGYIILFMVFMLFLPLFSMNYRYSLTKSDLFRQAPYKKNAIRYAEHLTTLGIVVFSFTLGFFFIMFGTMIMSVFTKVPEGYEDIYKLVHFHFGYYPLAFLVILVMGVLQYFISYLFVSRSNNLLNSIIMLILGELILLLLFYQPMRFFQSFYYLHQSTFVLPIITYQEVFEGLITYGKPGIVLTTNNVHATTHLVLYILEHVVYVALGVLGIVAFVVEKDPSSEYAGKAKTNRPYQDIIYHLGAFIVASFMCGLTQSLLYFSISYVFFLASYYTFFGILNRNFIPKVKDIILLVSVALLVAMFSGGLFINRFIVLQNNGQDIDFWSFLIG